MTTIHYLASKAVGPRRARARGIVTRDQRGFRRATLPVYSPTELLASLRVAE